MTTCATCYTGPCDDSLPSSKKRQAQACEGRAGGEPRIPATTEPSAAKTLV